MRIVCIWREDEDYSRSVVEWIREFERRTGKEVESIDPDSREGVGFSRTYDIVEYPTIVALDEKGVVMEMWRGRGLPLFDSVGYWAGK